MARVVCLEKRARKVARRGGGGKPGVVLLWTLDVKC
jgi:hypothetical protein